MRGCEGSHVLVSIRKVACRSACTLEAWHLHELVVCIEYLRQVHRGVACTVRGFKEQAFFYVHPLAFMDRVPSLSILIRCSLKESSAV